MTEKKAKKCNEKFLIRGLRSKSRHPSCYRESTLWTRIVVVAGGVLAGNVGLAGGVGGTVLALVNIGVSPAFTTFLLFKIRK